MIRCAVIRFTRRALHVSFVSLFNLSDIVLYYLTIKHIGFAMVIFTKNTLKARVGFCLHERRLEMIDADELARRAVDLDLDNVKTRLEL